MIVANKAGSNWVPTDGPPFSICSSRSGAGNTLSSRMWAYSPVDSSWPSLWEDDTTTLVVLTRMRTTARCPCHCCSVPRSSVSLLSTNADRTKITAQVREMKAKPTLVHFTGPANPDVEIGLNYWVQPHTHKPWGYAVHQDIHSARYGRRHCEESLDEKATGLSK